LNDEDKELAKELTQSILRGEKSTQLLLQLLNNKTIDDELREEVKKISNHTFDFEIITLDDKEENIIPTDGDETPNLRVKTTVFASAKRQCDDLCRNANTPEKIKACKKCLKGL
ncbi:MAG: hypothetical protein ACKPER_02235, partial [Dolichospermum sp.]